MKRLAAVCVGLLLVSTSAALAQETTGEIAGTVTDPDGLALPGVEISIRDGSTGLARTALTTSRGQFRFPALVPSQYEFQATASGFQPYQARVQVSVGQSLRHDVMLAVGAFSDVVDVTGEVPPVDFRSTTTSLTVKINRQMDTLPVQREVTQIALLAPGTARAPRVWDEPGMGWGTHTPGQSYASVGGGSVGENAYVVDGLNLSNFRYGLGASFVPVVLIDEVQVKLGGFEAEYGRATGGVINMVTRRGSNEFRGGLSLFWEPEALQETAPDNTWFRRSREKREVLEGNAWLGGPILRDKLFFFAGLQYTDYSAIENYQVFWEELDVSRSTPYWGGKIDWILGPAHRVEATYFTDTTERRGRDWLYHPALDERVAYRGDLTSNAGGENLVLRYNGVLRENLLLAVGAGRNQFDRYSKTSGDECPSVFDHRPEHAPNPGCDVQIYRTPGNHGDLRSAYRIDLDWFVGGHSIRGGVDLELMESRDSQEYSGGVQYIYRQNGTEGEDPDEFFFPDLPWDQDLVTVSELHRDGVFDTNSYAAYLQDSWVVKPGLTLNFGLRWEAYENKNELGQTFIETNDQWAPRLGVVWDPSANGRSRLYASWGVFHFPVLSKFNINLASAVYDVDSWYLFDGELNADGSPSPPPDGDPYAVVTRGDGTTPDPKEVLSDNFDPMAQQELIIGYEHMIGRNWTVGVRGVMRRYDQVLDDYAIDVGLYELYGVECANPALAFNQALDFDDEHCGFEMRLGNPGADFRGWYDLGGDGVLDRIFIPAAVLGIPAARRDRYAIDLTVARRFSNRWSMSGSYTWSHTYGNYGGVIDSDNTANDPRLMSPNFDSATLMENSYGDLAEDRRHNLILWGQYTFDFGLSLGSSFFYQSGRPVNSFGRHPTDPFANTYNNPYTGITYSFFTDDDPRPRGCCGRTDDLWNLDLMLNYTFRGLGGEWFVRLDVFNVFNNSGTEMVWDYAETWYGAPVPEYLETFHFQRPRIVRFGVGWSF